MALAGGDFANHYLSQSTSWLDSIILAVGPLGVPSIIVAAIRVGGDPFLKVLIGEARKSEAGVEKDLKSSTSNEVCERWDGDKVMRVEMKDPLIKELIYAGGIWYDLKSAAEAGIVTNTKNDAEKRIDIPALPPNLSLNLSNT